MLRNTRLFVPSILISVIFKRIYYTRLLLVFFCYVILRLLFVFQLSIWAEVRKVAILVFEASRVH